MDPPSPSSSPPLIQNHNQDDTLHMQVRLPNGDKVPLLVDVNATVFDLRVLIYAATNIPEHRQKLVYAGVVIQPNINDTNDGQSTLCSQYNFRSGTTIYLIVLRDSFTTPSPTTSTTTLLSPTTPTQLSGSSSSLPSNTNNTNTTTTTTTTTTNNNNNNNNNRTTTIHDQLASMLNTSPMMDIIMNNPEFLHNMVMQDPRMRELSESNPDIARMLSDRDFLRQLIRTSSNPVALREMQRTQDRALANLETIPGGFMALQRMYSQTAGALDDVMTKPTMTTQQEEIRSKHLASTLGVKSVKPGSLNTQALPNPWTGVKSSSSSSSSSSTSTSSLFNNSNNHLGMVFPPGFIMPPYLASLQQPQNTTALLPNHNNNNNNNNNQLTISEDDITHHPYMTQLNHMVDMGFDRNESARYLIQTNGNIDMAVDLVVATLMVGDNDNDNDSNDNTHDSQ